jgi:hypothetical protein
LIGRVDPLQALQDVHHFVRIHDPLDVAPSSVCGTDYSWNDGMRTLAYEVNSGTNVKHVFTGNQEILQEDATRLLLAVQKDVILSRSDLQSAYYILDVWFIQLYYVAYQALILLGPRNLILDRRTQGIRKETLIYQDLSWTSRMSCFVICMGMAKSAIATSATS